MTINLSIKNVPDAVADAIRTRAAQNHRSLQGELMAILEQSVSGTTAQTPAVATHSDAPPARIAPALSIDEVAARAAKLFPKGTASSVNFIREMRDGRYGEEWANSGRHSAPD